MSKRIKDILKLTDLKENEYRKEIIRTPWDHIFLLESWLWAQRSHDPQTQCGCVLVRYNTVLSTGYNGFISEIHDEELPNLRPINNTQTISKYPFMIHAEHNAILNCARNGVSTIGSTAYVTGEPCNNCLQYMWQAGVSKIVYSDFNNPVMMQNEQHNNIKTALLVLMENRMDISYIPSSIIKIPEKFLDKLQTY